MKDKILFPVCLAIALVLAPPADAKKKRIQNIDFGNMSCSEFIEEVKVSDQEDIGAVLLWLDGYLSGVTGDTVLNWNKLEVITERLIERCKERGKENLLNAIRRVGAE